MDYTDNQQASANAARVVRRILESAATPRGEAAAEFLIALATGRMKLAKEHLANVFENLPTQTPLVDELVALCRSRLSPSWLGSLDGRMSATDRNFRRPAAERPQVTSV